MNPAHEQLLHRWLGGEVPLDSPQLRAAMESDSELRQAVEESLAVQSALEGSAEQQRADLAAAAAMPSAPGEEKVLELTRVYLAMCKNIDLQLNRVLDRLEKLGELENTLIIYTSDHGDFNGEHQLIQKFNCGYDGCCRVPLLISYPGTGVAGRVCNEPVNLTDLPATIGDILGWDDFQQTQGSSLADVVLNDTYQPRNFTVVESGVPGESLTEADIKNFPDHRYDIEPVGRWCYDPPHRFGGKMYAVRSKDYKLIVRQDQKAEFYDMKNDPWETVNQIDNKELSDHILAHYQYLSQHLCRISTNSPDVSVAAQDEWYRAGGDKTWSESLPERFRESTK